MVKSVKTVMDNDKTKGCKLNQVAEFAEVKDMISKLRKIVSPHMPREKKVSKLEVIEHVIDYINELQGALESHPAGRDLSRCLRRKPNKRHPEEMSIVKAMASSA